MEGVTLESGLKLLVGQFSNKNQIKWAKDVIEISLEKNIQMTKSSASLGTRGSHLRPTETPPHTLQDVLPEKQNINRVGEDAEKSEPCAMSVKV